jgi:ATP-binding cassette, subfamily B, bacterial
MKINEKTKMSEIFFMFFRKHLFKVLIVLFFVTIAEIADISIIYITKLIFDKIVVIEPTKENLIYLMGFVLIYFVAHFFRNVGYRFSGFSAMKLMPLIQTEFRVKLFNHLRKHSHNFFVNNFAGSVANKINQAGSAIRDLYGIFFWNIYNGIVFFIFSIILLYQISLILVIVELVIFGFYFGYALYILPKGIPLHKEYANARSKTTGKLVDSIGNFWNIMAFSKGKFEEKLIEDVCIKENKKHIKSWKFFEIFRFTNNLLVDTITTITTGIGIYLWYTNVATVGDIILIVGLSKSLAKITSQLSRDMLQISEKESTIRDAVELIAIKHDIKDKDNAVQFVCDKGKIEIKDMDFVYPNTKEKIFEKLNIVIEPKQKVALVGRSGSGKTTFIKLLLRIYDATSGKIIIDGKDIKDVTLNSLRENIGIVPQDPELFHRTLKENIAYGKQQVNDDEIIRAAKLANVDEFVEKLEEKYDTLVGERGIKLSGGQKQRIAIARAILKDAPILILDEATSALDSESETLIQDAFEPLTKNKTVIAIAHRLSTINKFDRILVFDYGVIVEDGTHEELIKKNGVYAHLWDYQSGGY